MVDGIELDVCCGCVESNLLLGVFEPLVRRVNAGAGGLDVLALGITEHQRLHGGTADGRLAGREAVGKAHIGGDYEVGDERVLRLGECALRLFQIGLSKLDGGRVALGQIYHRR